MKWHRVHMALWLLATVCFGSGNAQTKVVLKLDDIGAKNNRSKSLPVMNYLLERRVKASYGVIADRLDSTAARIFSEHMAAKDAAGKPMIEIWNHGLHHWREGNVFEFKNRSFEEQSKSFDWAHRIVRDLLHVEMTCFGAPYNAVDSICLQVVTANPVYKNIFFSKQAYPIAIQRLNNNVPMEKATGKPDLAHFIEQYERHPEYRSTNIILQGHPPYWSDEGFAEFRKILDFLDSRGCIYVLPAEL